MNDTQNEVKIITYEAQYKEAFKTLNEEWIKTFFVMEPGDYKLLDHPEEEILNKGGHIAFALLDGEVVGTCALVKTHDNPLIFELSKMAVSPKAQGKKLGYLLGNALVEKAKDLKAEKVFLVTNSMLVPAIRLYEKLGFQHIPVTNAGYDRVDVQMELYLNK
ncbi:GNAT family N-acetyltransferase [Chryseobacterium pennipullorum]|uniref:MarR family transcriptional regulator n=1 Tax=Chryseobacterium pennipullorum TaxID=2258963 RepID=A0A3D9AM14_9FLAO|nr:GNAT family N-acetyltransferase [Chryseobacterium pennipullorum]REC42360.1 MarR family transcriptional regulator [Chryseobacterium pennipullorum]